MLLRNRYTVGELAAACGIPSHMASEHLRLMQHCGFLVNQKEGRKAYYRVVETHLASIIACIEERFGGKGGNSMNTQYHLHPQLSELCRSGRPIELIDVRTPAEFREVHVQGAQKRSLGPARSGRVDQDPQRRAGPLYLICKSGGRSTQACEKFIKAGFTDVVNVEGGTTACVDAGLPVVRGRRPFRWSGKSASPPARSCCWARLERTSILTSSGCPPLSARGWSLPASPTPAAWACCLPACRGTSSCEL